jgi:hypothetical protein
MFVRLRIATIVVGGVGVVLVVAVVCCVVMASLHVVRRIPPALASAGMSRRQVGIMSRYRASDTP